MSDRPKTRSWPPTDGTVTWPQLVTAVTLLVTLAGGLIYGHKAIAEEGAAARAEAKELVRQESTQAARLFATREDVKALQVQLEEALRILRQLDEDRRRDR